MPTPSNPSGIPSLPVVGLLAVILFVGLALAPRAFEFRAWPEPSRHEAIEEVVDRPVAPVTEVQVAGVTARSPRREPGPERAERRRRPERGSARAPKSSPARPQARDHRSSSRPAPAAPVEPETVVEIPAPPAEVEEPPPAQPAQLAERPPVDQVLRPEPEPETFVPEGTPADDFSAREAREHEDCKHRRGHGHGDRPGRRHRGN